MAYHLKGEYELVGKSYRHGSGLLSLPGGDAHLSSAQRIGAWIRLNHLFLQLDYKKLSANSVTEEEAETSRKLLSVMDIFDPAEDVKDYNAQWHVIAIAAILATIRFKKDQSLEYRERAIRWYSHLPPPGRGQIIGPTYLYLLEQYPLLKEAFPGGLLRVTNLEVLCAEVRAWFETLAGQSPPGAMENGRRG